MQYRRMGSLKWEVSALSFGCMRLPSRRFSLMGADLEESKRIIRYGIDRGINYIDTAWPYHLGESEKVVGEILKDGYREKVHLVTKLPMFLVRRTEDFDRYLSAQLEKLQTEYLDIYLFHSLNKGAFEKVKRLGLIDKMEQAQRQGRIRAIGFSFHDTYPVFKEIVDYYDWDMAQIQYNYMDTGIQATTDGLEYAHDKGIAVVVMEPVKGGTLANPPAEALDVMHSAGNNRTPVDWAMQFLWNRPEVATVLSGMGNIKMVEENCDSADRSGINSFNQVDKYVINKLAEIYREKILVPCTGAILNNVSLEQSRVRQFQVRRGYKKLADSEEKIDQLNPIGNASLCINCGECLEKCPQEINIPVELERVHAILGKRESINKFYS